MAKNETAATPVNLEEKVAELEASLTASAKEKDDLTAINLDQGKQLEALNAENESLKAVNAELSKELASFSEKNLEAVVEKAQKQEAPKLSAETFKVDGKEYGFVSPVMMFKKVRITNADVLASPELQAELVNAKAGMVKAVG